MGSSCEEMACAVGVGRQRDENTVIGRNECGVTWSVKLEASSEMEVVSGGFGDECCLCGERFAFLDHQTGHFIKNKDKVCCHFCQMKFSHMNSLALHLKNVHPKYHMLCKSCNMYMGQHVANEWTVETDKTPKKEPLDEEVEEIIIENEEVEIKYENEEVEIKYVKEEEEEVVIGKMEETKENSITETPEDHKMVNSNLHDHTYFSTQKCSSFRELTNNVVMYTSSENVLVFINKKDIRISPKDSYTENDQQGTPVVDQTVCGVIHDHIYSSNPSFANPTFLAKQVSAQNTCSLFTKTVNTVINSRTENIHVFYNKDDTRISPEDSESTESDQDHTWNHDHTYFTKESCANSEFEHIQEDVVVGDYEEVIQTSDHEDHDSSSTGDLVYTSQDDLSSDTICCISTNSSANTSKDGSKTQVSCSTCPKKNSENTKQTSQGPVDPVNSNPATSLYKDLQICTSCSLGKVPNPKKSMAQFTCTPFTCSLCGIVFGTEEMLLNHQAEKHPLAKCVCVKCLQPTRIFPNQNIFIQHVCSKSEEFSGESLTPSKSSNNLNKPLLTILNCVPSPAVSSKQPISIQSANVGNKALNHGPVVNSTSHSLPNSPSTSATQKVPVQATKSSGCTQEKKVACLVLNGDQGQVTTPISTVTQKQIGQVQLLCPLQAKVVTPTSSSTQTLLISAQGQGQNAPISTVPQTKSGQLQFLIPLQTKLVTHTPTGSAELTSSIVLPQQHRSYGVHLPPLVSQVSSSLSIPSETGQLSESNVPFLDICRTLSTKILPSSQGPLKVVAMFVNRSKELALQKRMHQSWRSKAVFPCRQCGAVSRQFSLGVRHRYQHRGPRIHRCQCGRAFQQRMHLLRHQVQHAEATRYVCATCGQMFCGTQKLACHKPFFRVRPSNKKNKSNKECRNMFRCYCGHSFTRPAALLWHMLKNSKARKPRLKGFRLT